MEIRKIVMVIERATVKYLFFIFSLIFYTSCNNITEKKTVDNYIKVISRSNGLCSYIIKLNEDGKGSITRVEVDNFDKKTFFITKKIDNVLFDLKTKDDLVQLEQDVKAIKTQGNFVSKKNFDGNHTELYIDDNLFIDTYGRGTDSYQSLIGLIAKNIPYSLDYDCR